MRVYGVAKTELEQIARDLGFRLENERTGGVRRPWVGFTLRMAAPLPSRVDLRWSERADTRVLNPEEDAKYHKIVGALKYRARSVRNPRWANGAVCWHGHAEFMRRMFEAHPEAMLISKMAKYTSRADFMARHEETGMRNVGSQMYPIQAREGCDCYGG